MTPTLPVRGSGEVRCAGEDVVSGGRTGHAPIVVLRFNALVPERGPEDIRTLRLDAVDDAPAGVKPVQFILTQAAVSFAVGSHGLREEPVKMC